MTTSITMHKVANSTNVEAHGYDQASRTLAVQFKSGGFYHYEGVPPEKYAQLVSAKSVGSFVAREIRPHFKAVPIPHHQRRTP